ncbi:GNAT family N-acetyltransferase [Acinetobacter sp. A47]|uniref:GNAT family N-acetyltransferase n=1 Tax=Acinetobacter sp. A47 TaxID=1561217 RepID=UPI00056E1282|nr:GNAT family N-acetyltransferase [Acinetobacter sp. A47]
MQTSVNTADTPSLHDLDGLAEIFNAYRVFYQQASDLAGARQFIEDRLKHKDSVLFIRKNDTNKIIGFVQLYPTFSSVSLGKAWILNDLYVEQSYRRQGIAASLMQQAIDFAQQTDARFIALETTADNIKAQTLYRKLGFQEQSESRFFAIAFPSD